MSSGPEWVSGTVALPIDVQGGTEIWQHLLYIIKIMNILCVESTKWTCRQSLVIYGKFRLENQS